MTQTVEDKGIPGGKVKVAGWRIGCVAATLTLMLLPALPARATELHPGVTTSDPVWTDRPVRIDRRKQTYERLAVAAIPIPWRIRVTSRATVFDSGSFSEGGRFYVLTDIVPVDPSRVCRDAPGTIAICGQQARIALRRRIANRTVSCLEDSRSGRLSFVTCRLDGKDLAEALVAAGAGWAGTSRLQAAEEKAVQQKLGIWRDAECRQFRRCPPQSGLKR